jgi:hypothetical protein
MKLSKITTSCPCKMVQMLRRMIRWWYLSIIMLHLQCPCTRCNFENIINSFRTTDLCPADEQTQFSKEYENSADICKLLNVEVWWTELDCNHGSNFWLFVLNEWRQSFRWVWLILCRFHVESLIAGGIQEWSFLTTSWMIIIYCNNLASH